MVCLGPVVVQRVTCGFGLPRAMARMVYNWGSGRVKLGHASFGGSRMFLFRSAWYVLVSAWERSLERVLGGLCDGVYLLVEVRFRFPFGGALAAWWCNGQCHGD